MRAFRSLLLVASLIPAAAFAASAPEPTDEGAKAYQKGAYSDAEKMLRPLAEQGNPKAMYYMGFM